MREDLPFEEPLPDLWSISLAVGGDLVGGGPRLEDFHVLQSLQLELGKSRRRYWRVESVDGRNSSSSSNQHVLNVLCEHRFHLPERLAVPQLGRLRELMLREARLLDSLSHECIVPLERGWLEQRTGAQPTDDFFHETHPKTRAGALAKNVDRPPAATQATQESAPAESLPSDTCPCRETLRPHGGCARQPRISSPVTVRSDSCSARRSPDPERGPPTDPLCFVGGAFRYQDGDDDAAAFLLRSCVPLTVADVDDGDDDDSEEEEGDGVPGSRGHGISEGRVQRFGASKEQDRWGGDGTTGWRGIAEPKSTAVGRAKVGLETASGVAAPPPAPPLRKERCGPVADQGCAFRNGGLEDAGGDSRSARQKKRTLRLASYLLLPDWLPLRLWFETEFRPRTAAPGARGGGMVAVSAAEDWVIVWRQLVQMFLQVVRGVDYLHTQGVVHNNIHPGSVWVAADGTCRVGGVSQATPPGCRRPPPPAESTRRPFCSPEHRRGSKVDSHSDVYSLGVLLLEFWCSYLCSRGLGNLGSVGDGRVVDLVRSGGAGGALQPEAASGLLNAALVSQMLADDSLDRPDCFEILDELAESS